jgi:23S rRNA (adenine2503-C2)-methyltransferase
MVIENIYKSKDNMAIKYQLKLDDNNIIECLYVDYHNKHIICYSSQVGCIIGCKMCNNGINASFVRNLTTDEIVEQCEIVLKNIDNSKPILFSCMGIGEPLLNLTNLSNAIIELAIKYPNTKFALATTAVIPEKILELLSNINPINIKITISLHASNNEIRNKIIPNLNNIDEILKTRKVYNDNYNRDFEWNYVLLDNINDSEYSAHELSLLLGKDSYIKINKFNTIDNCNFKESSPEKIKTFLNILMDNNLNVEQYETNGSDIQGACGQMRIKKTLER